ncbi:MAG: hypothetical protein PHU49_02850 [Syntrophorhabdaceae bacterium]|nr:hypothetical protein [Syntrophorhabdaceae bacterium]
MKQIPSYLTRFFEKEEYALDFIRGKIRFGSLSYYRHYEGSRGDKTEGLQFFTWDRGIRYQGSSVHEHYILCTSGPDVDIYKMKTEMGQVVVRIENPQLLLEKIRSAWSDHRLSIGDRPAEIAQVVYDKGGVHEADPFLIAPPVYMQKPMQPFAGEKEWRYVLTCRLQTERTAKRSETRPVLESSSGIYYFEDSSFDDHLELNIGDCGEICRFT